MNALEKYIKEQGLSEVVSKKTYDLKNKDGESVGIYARVLHNTTTGQSIFLKHFFKQGNKMISINETATDAGDGYYISETTQDGEIVPEFQASIDIFKSKPASLRREIKAVEI